MKRQAGKAAIRKRPASRCRVYNGCWMRLAACLPIPAAFSQKSCPAHASLDYIKSIKTVINHLKPMMTNIPSSSEASADKISAVKGFYQSLNNVLNDQKQANCIAWSPVNRQGTIAIDEPFAGLGFSKFVRGISDHQPPLSVMPDLQRHSRTLR